MKYILTVAVVIAAFALVSFRHKKKGDAWISLFDGKTTTGWHSWKQDKVSTRWKVKDGAVGIDPTVKTGTGDLVSNEAFENFDLKLQWKISPGGNSGIIFYVADDPKYEDTYNTGLEMQVLDNDKHADGKIYKHRAGNLYDLVAGPDNVKPVGEWNDVEIVSNRGRLKLFLNGKNVVTTTLWDDNWKKMVASSKFKQWPDFGTFKKGHIALQDHGNEVWFRNIMIKKL